MAYVGDLDAEFADFDLTRQFFTEQSCRALENADRISGDHERWEARPGVPANIDALWASTLVNCSADEIKHLQDLIDIPRAINLFARLLSGKTGAERDLYLGSGEVDPECFTESTFEAITGARERAGRMGYDRVQDSHLFLALLENPEGPADRLIRLHCNVGVSPADLSRNLTHLLERGAARGPHQIPLDKEHLSRSVQNTLSQAQAQAEINGASAITQAIVLWALLARQDGGPIDRSLAETLPTLDRARLIREVEDLTRKPEDSGEGHPFLLTGLAGKSEDLTYQASVQARVPSVGQEDLLDLVLRGLHKRTRNNVLITGESGVGKTQLVLELSRRVAAGEVSFLRRRKIVLLDCSEVSPENSRSELEKMLGQVKGRKDVILCLDHLENILRYAGQRESSNLHILRAALTAGSVQIIGILEDRHYVDLLSGDHRTLHLFSRVEVPALEVETTQRVLHDIWRQKLQQTYELTITPEAIEKATRASDEFIMSERLPEKAIKVLREACERVSYEVEKGVSGSTVTEDAVVQAIAGFTGISASTISGIGQRDSFADELEKSVVGQELAVRAVVNRLKLIKAGAVRPGRPAAVFLFAGPTGTGKTELAKAVARVYSASHKLVRYDMTRFGLEHSIQGLFGVPPGYVGYESGGQLVNDLNADPYSVILFDEAEKAHQSIWQGMLSLFDEGWVVDQRNVKAYGNRAIFVLTTNAAKDLIRDRLPLTENLSADELEKLRGDLSEALLKYENPQTHNRPFSAEFLGRLTDVVVFGRLSHDALRKITNLQIETLISEWKISRKKSIQVDNCVRERVAEQSFIANQGREGNQGGRAVQASISREVELALIQLITESPDKYKCCPGLRVFRRNGNTVAEFVSDRNERMAE